MLGKPPCNLHENNPQNNIALHIKQGHAYSHCWQSNYHTQYYMVSIWLKVETNLQTHIN